MNKVSVVKDTQKISKVASSPQFAQNIPDFSTESSTSQETPQSQANQDGVSS